MKAKATESLEGTPKAKSKERLPRARLETMATIRETVIPAYMGWIPDVRTLRTWFDEARIPRFKANPLARRGGGPVLYSVAHVERWLRARTLPGRLAVAETAEVANG